MPKTELDATDHQLLSLLRENARTPTAALARKLGLSRTTVQSRIDRLERARVVSGYTVRVSGAAEAGLVRACVLITLAPRQGPGIEAALRRLPQVRTLHAVSGAFDLLAMVAADGLDELNSILDRIGQLEGVERTTSAVVLSTRIER